MFGEELIKDFNKNEEGYAKRYLVTKFKDPSKNAVWNYVSGYITNINNLLRAGYENRVGVSALTKLIDSAFTDKWDKDLYRIVDWNFMQNVFGINRDNLDSKIGTILEDGAYMSTTKNFENPWSSSYLSDELILYINNKEQISCIDVNKMFKADEIDCENQDEIILPRHTRLKIKGYHKEYDDPKCKSKYQKYDFNGTYVIDVELMKNTNLKDMDNKDILEKYGLTYWLVSVNENKMADKLNEQIRNLIAEALKKLEQQQRFQDAKAFAAKVKDVLKTNTRLRAILYCVLGIILTFKIFGVKETQDMVNGQYTDGQETVECKVEDNGDIFVEDVKEDNNQEDQSKEIWQIADFIDDFQFGQNIVKDDDFDFAKDFKLSKEGKEFIKSYEVLHLKAYYATKSERTRKILTIGYGHVIKKNDPQWLKNLKEGDEITQRQADQLFDEDVAYFENEAKRLLLKNKNGVNKPTYYTQGFMDAFISMIFNCGAGNIQNTQFFTKLMRCCLDKENDTIRPEDYNYTISFVPNTLVRQKGKVLDGLVRRRAEEYQMMKIM